MEGSLNVDNFDKSLLFSISFSMEGSLLSNLQIFTLKFGLTSLTAEYPATYLHLIE